MFSDVVVLFWFVVFFVDDVESVLNFSCACVFVVTVVIVVQVLYVVIVVDGWAMNSRRNGCVATKWR